MKRGGCLILLLLLSCFETPTIGNFVVNGDFETGDFFGWTSSGTAYVVSDSGARTLAGGIGNWPTGTYVVDFGGGAGDVPDNGVISQTIATIANSNYILTFDYGAFGQGGQSINIQVQDADNLSLLNALSISDSTATLIMNNVFNSYQLLFGAIGDSTTISFISTSTSNNRNSDGLLDNISLIESPRIIPAPGAIVLGGIGVSFVAWLRRRRTI